MSLTFEREKDTEIIEAISDADQYWEAAGKPRLALLCADLSRVPIHRGGLSPSQLASRRAALANERRAMIRVLCKLDTSFNDLQPVNFLPSEVLTHIFMLVVDACSEPLRGLFTMPGTIYSFSLRWLGLTRVCKRWRVEALSCPSLWGRLETSMQVQVLEAFVQRSQTASMSVTTDRLRLRKGLPERLAVILSPNVLERTKTLYISYEALGRMASSHLKALTNPMPRLEAFTYRHKWLSGQDPDGDGNLPSDLFSGVAPRLRQLTFQYPSSIPQFPHFYRNLQLLCIRTMPDHGFTSPSFSNLFQLLESMPDLESLELTHTLPIEPSAQRRATPMSRYGMKTLVLEGPIMSCICVVRELRVSSNCKIGITCSALGAPEDSLANLLDAIVVTGIKDISPRSLCAVSDEKGHLHVAAYEEKFELEDVHGYPSGFTPAGFDFFPRDEPTLFNLNMRGLTLADNTSMPTRISAICTRFLSLERLELLSIYIDMGEDIVTDGPTASNELHELWTSVLGLCPRLREIHCARAPAYVLLRELAAHEASWFLPALETLCLDEDHLSRDLLYDTASLYDLLFNALQNRPIPYTKICDRQPFLIQTDVAALHQLTDLTFFEREYGDDAQILGAFPDNFFAFGPNVVEVDEELEMAQAQPGAVVADVLDEDM